MEVEWWVGGSTRGGKELSPCSPGPSLVGGYSLPTAPLSALLQGWKVCCSSSSHIGRESPYIHPCGCPALCPGLCQVGVGEWPLNPFQPRAPSTMCLPKPDHSFPGPQPHPFPPQPPCFTHLSFPSRPPSPIFPTSVVPHLAR